MRTIYKLKCMVCKKDFECEHNHQKCCSNACWETTDTWKRTVYKNGHIGLVKELNPAWKGGVTLMKGYRALMEKIREQRKKGNGGSHSIKDWLELKVKYNFTCPSCFRIEPEIKLTRDHIIPLLLGGTNNIDNIQPLCGTCNGKKSTKIIKYAWSCVTVYGSLERSDTVK